MTQRYVHTEAETSDQVFSRTRLEEVGTNLGTEGDLQKATPAINRKEGSVIY
jgi:hypothetical protein